MTPPQELSFDQILCRLHLHAVLPALEELVQLSAAAQSAVKGWNFSWRLSVLGGGPAITLRCQDGILKTFLGQAEPAAVNLVFLSARQLNRSFNNQSALPPLPIGAPWQWAKLRPFVALSRILNEYLQPSEEALAADADFREVHRRLLLGVLGRAAPLVGRLDRPSVATLAEAPPGCLELRVPAFDFVTRFGEEPGAPASRNTPIGRDPAYPLADATIVFRDLETLDAALHGRLDAAVAIGLGRLEVQGLIPLADVWSYVLDRVEFYLQPKSAPVET